MADKKREVGKENVERKKERDRRINKNNGRVEEKEIVIKLINMQGLTKEKYVEVEKLLEKYFDIICITEGQNKVDKIQTSRGICKLEVLREDKDKKGGGLMILVKEGKVKLEITPSKSKDILDVEGRVGKEDIRLILVYMAAGSTAQAKVRNDKIREEIEQKIINNTKENLMVLGDMNGHIGILGEQEEDRNGRMILNWVNDFNLVMLNMDERCKGKYTWCANDRKSVIDYMLVNGRMYNRLIGLEIDEEKENIDLSDHNLMQASFWYSIEKEKHKESQTVQQTYISMKEDALKEFSEEMLKEVRLDHCRKITEINRKIKSVAERTLRRSGRNRMPRDREREEPVWMTKEILRGIKERKALNREKRNETDAVKKGQLEQMYLCKKRQVQSKIQEEMSKYEIKKTEEIKKDKSRKVWDNIRMLRGQSKGGEENIHIYDLEGNKLNDEVAGQEVEKYWGDIYRKHENKMIEVWNEHEKRKYDEKIEREDYITTRKGTFHYSLREHMDMAMEVENQIKPMRKPEFSVQKVAQRIKKLKCKKAAGPDGIKAEIYKALADKEEIVVALTECFQNEIEEKEKPSEWKLSRTKMIEKRKKPTAKDLRPIALTDISYKLFMSLIKDEIEAHLRINNEMKETQAGFTEGGRGEDNLFLLQYCIEESYRRKTPLVVVSVDFSKAYDSIKREKIIEVMKQYKIHPQVIEAIAEVYKEDKTIIEIGNMKKEMKVSSGIRQGCTGSTTIFKLITYRIIKELEKKGQGFMNEFVEILALFFADDGLLVADTIESAKRNIRILKEVGRACGLEINAAKSNVVIFNAEEKPEYIEEIEVKEVFVYLGVEIISDRNIFRKHISKMIEKAQRLANVTYSVIGKCCNKVLIGKTFWKSVALPSILYATNVMNIDEKDIERLQVIENGVYRKILGAPKYAPNCTLRGEIGASLMKSRVIEGRLQYIRSIWDRENGLLKLVLEDQFDRPGKWMKKTMDWMEYVNVSKRELKNLGRKGIKEKVREKDSNRWKEELETKSSLGLYKGWKKDMKEEQIYDNRKASEILYRARSNSLMLEDRSRHSGGRITCRICDQGTENLTHFILECEGLIEERGRAKTLQRPHPEDQDEVLGAFLFDQETLEENKVTLYDMWKKRRKILKEEN